MTRLSAPRVRSKVYVSEEEFAALQRQLEGG